jgi:hypothetical protein
MIGIGSMALLGAISFAPAFAQQGGGQQDKDKDQQHQHQRDSQGGMGQTGGQTGGQLRQGAQAPQFNLFEVKGQVFVLEFINPTDQNWVKLHEDKLKSTYERYKEQGIVWFAVCSFENTAGQQGLQGGGQQGGQQGGMRPGQVQQPGSGTIQGIAKTDRQQLMQQVKRLNLDFPILFDEGGMIAKRFQITQIPHLVVVDGQGKIAYAAPLTGQGGQMAGVDQFERALGQAIQNQGSLPAGSPREQGQTGQQNRQGGQTQQEKDRERMDRERQERERNQQNRPR